MDFALFLFILLLITGVAWVAYWGFYRKRHLRVLAESDAVEARKAPWWYEYIGSFFLVILIVFCIRSFLVEPFRIPSTSMVPTLLIGDFIVTNKFAYGIRIPIINKKIVEVGEPQRGDIVVFQYPEDPSVNYVKRLIGRPGDTVTYRNKALFINGQEVPKRFMGEYLNKEVLRYSMRYEEVLDGVRYETLNDPQRPEGLTVPHDFPFRDACHYDATGFECKVPQGHYFMMGDNRDNSADSRIWGFVDDRLLVGKAFFIWFHLRDLKRIGPVQ